MVVWNTCFALVLGIQENIKQSLSASFLKQKRIAFKCSLELHFYALIIGFFRLGTVQNPISSDIPRCTPRLVSKIDYGFDQWSVVSFVIKKLFVYLFMVKECIYLVIQMYFKQIYFYFLWFGNKFTDYCRNFSWPYTQREI